MAVFGLADCNNFFVSCERVFRPDLNGRPVVVLSNNDGCVISRSNEAKKLGIAMGVPLFKIKNEIKRHGITVFSSNFELYGDISSRVMSLLSQYTPELSQYSIDEAFLGLSGFGNSEKLRLRGEEIVRKVQQCVHIPISLGIAPTKTLAKMASKFAKTYPAYNGVCIIDTEEKREKALRLFEVGDVFGIGHRSIEKLKPLNVKTAYDFTQVNEDIVRRYFAITGLRTQKELKGISCISTDDLPMKQSICTSRSFSDQGISDLSKLEEAIATFASECSRKLRQQQSCCMGISVFAHTSYFNENAPRDFINLNSTFTVATDALTEIVGRAVQMIRTRYLKGYQYKKAGVVLWGICANNAVQGNVFDTIDRTKQHKLTQTIDAINAKMGQGTIKLGVQGNFTLGDSIKSEYRSPRYSTKWNELPQVNCNI